MAYSIAELPSIRYERLLDNNAEEALRLLSACTNYGFFYLDLGTTETKDYLLLTNALFRVTKEYFARPIEEKLKDVVDDPKTFNTYGYKPQGLEQGNLENKKDGFEGMRVPADIFFNPALYTRLHRPEGVKKDWEVFMHFIGESHAMVSLILKALSDSLGLKGDQRYEAYNRSDKPSASAAVVQHYPLVDLPEDSSVGIYPHTDSGTISIIFTTDWGLQVYSPDRNDWESVAPKENHAIVNVGDSLKFLSDSRLKSCLHRVVPLHTHWKSGPRYSIMFFSRANDDAQFVDEQGIHWTAGEFMSRKFKNYRLTHSEQRANALSTGRKGFLGLLGDPTSVDVSIA